MDQETATWKTSLHHDEPRHKQIRHLQMAENRKHIPGNRGVPACHTRPSNHNQELPQLETQTYKMTNAENVIK